jgi:hypothetical protein
MVKDILCFSYFKVQKNLTKKKIHHLKYELHEKYCFWFSIKKNEKYLYYRKSLLLKRRI